MYRIAPIFLIVLLLEGFAMNAQKKAYDIVIYGCTSAGIAAAVQASKMGKSVVIVGPDKHLGGLTAGGLGWKKKRKKEHTLYTDD